MTTTTVTPTVTQSPYRVASDTWVIPEPLHAGDLGFVTINSLVIAGAEPVIVDTGTALNCQRWLDQVFSIVDPTDVRWVFLSHDDHDHVGNLLAVLELCPQATLVTSWFSLERLRGDYELPLSRCRWLNDGETFDAGDRTLVAARPPIYDAPTTRGLFDARSGVYWSVDCFGSPMPEPVDDACDLDRTVWEEMQLLCNRIISPWHTLLDQTRYDRLIDRTAALGATAIASAHGPAIRGPMVAEALRLLRPLPTMEAAALPDQADLEAQMTALGLA
ncbi:MAG TPA: MBL fold metallo-hydrolase [Acidimicrobiales bacterium]|nr:MBL fold metallo-hydrolase [Acidimicrobiales bacterium]